jgi:hypothetical protein
MDEISIFRNQHHSFTKINNRNLELLTLNQVLGKPVVNGKTQFLQYSKMLDKLLKYKNNGIINCDFISNFYRSIYYDKSGIFNIILDN